MDLAILNQSKREICIPHRLVFLKLDFAPATFLNVYVITTFLKKEKKIVGLEGTLIFKTIHPC